MPRFESRRDLELALKNRARPTDDKRSFLTSHEPGHRDVWKILAEGDSWFKYPRRFFVFGDDSNVIQCLEENDQFYIESDATNGDEIIEIFAGEKKNNLLKKVNDAFADNSYYDVLLVSGGGNDIVGIFDFDWLIQSSTGSDPANYINKKRLDSRINRIKDCYRELLGRVLELDKNIRVISHEYDYAIPMEKGYKLFDWIPIGASWMYPFLMRKGIEDRDLQRSIVKLIMSEFSMLQRGLESEFPNSYSVVKTCGSLTEAEWRNEIHPTPEGFGKIAKLFEAEIQKQPPRK